MEQAEEQRLGTGWASVPEWIVVDGPGVGLAVVLMVAEAFGDRHGGGIRVRVSRRPIGDVVVKFETNVSFVGTGDQEELPRAVRRWRVMYARELRRVADALEVE